MQFDWFTFGASLFNFVLLLVLLRVFVFKRILRAMETRQKRLSKQWDEANQAKEAADEARSEHQRRLDGIEEERRRILEEAREETETERSQRFEELRKEIEEQRRSWVESLARDREDFFAEVRDRVGRVTIDTVRATLTELADQELEEQIVTRFLSVYGTQAPDGVDGPVTVYTARELPQDVQKRIEDGIKEVHPDAASVQLEVDKELIAGIEVRLQGRRIGFSLAHHLDAAEERLGELVAESAAESTDE